jgi:hypothetical protein
VGKIFFVRKGLGYGAKVLTFPSMGKILYRIPQGAQGRIIFEDLGHATA